MIHPPFVPTAIPKRWRSVITSVRNVGHDRHLVVYMVMSPDGYSEQRCACVLEDGRVKWDMIVWADADYTKEYRAQRVERVRLKDKKSR